MRRWQYWSLERSSSPVAPCSLAQLTPELVLEAPFPAPFGADRLSELGPDGPPRSRGGTMGRERGDSASASSAD